MKIAAFCLMILQAFVSLNIAAQNGERIIVDEDIHLIPLFDSIYIHETWHFEEKYGRFSSNGMVLIRNGNALLIDTPVDTKKTERLVFYIENNLSASVTQVIVCHYHNDCLGGLQYLHDIGVESIGNVLTAQKCRELSLPVPEKLFASEYQFNFFGEPVECRFPGAGHTVDNIVVWFPNTRILFGGCLIKSSGSEDLGNLADAVIREWEGTIHKIAHSYKEILTVVPGHGDYGGTELLITTQELIKTYFRTQLIHDEQTH